MTIYFLEFNHPFAGRYRRESQHQEIATTECFDVRYGQIQGMLLEAVRDGERVEWSNKREILEFPQSTE